MTITVHFTLLVVAFACFALATFGVPLGRLNVTALGLAFWVLSLILN